MNKSLFSLFIFSLKIWYILVIQIYKGPLNISFLSIPEVGDKQWAWKKKRERKSMLTMVSTYAWTKIKIIHDMGHILLYIWQFTEPGSIWNVSLSFFQMGWEMGSVQHSYSLALRNYKSSKLFTWLKEIFRSYLLYSLFFNLCSLLEHQRQNKIRLS